MYADSDSAEDIVEDLDAAVDEEDDDEDVLVEEDQMQSSVCTVPLMGQRAEKLRFDMLVVI